MANGDFSVQQLVADVRRRAMIPNSTQVLTDADITGFLNDEMWEYIVPMLMATTEEYLVAEKDLGVPASTVIDLEDQDVFTGGVIGLKIRDVQVQSGNAWISLPRIEPEREGQQFFASNATQGYMFRGSKIHLVPVNQTPGAAIRVLYYKRPDALIQTPASLGSYGATAYNAPLYEGQAFPVLLTFYQANAATTLTWLLENGSYYGYIDIYNGDGILAGTSVRIRRGAGVQGQLAYIDTAADANNLNFTLWPPVTASGTIRATQARPQIPQDLCPLLIQRAVYRCLDALGDSRSEAAAASAERTRVTCIQLISPRGEGSARVIINYNGPGWTYRRRPYSMR